jgi:hypothetical protein
MADEKHKQLAVIGAAEEKSFEESIPETVDEKKKKMKRLYTGEGRADILAMLDELPPSAPTRRIEKDPKINGIQIFFGKERVDGRNVEYTLSEMLSRASKWGKYVGQRAAMSLEDKRNAMRALSVEVKPKVNGVHKSPSGMDEGDVTAAPRFPEDDLSAKSIVPATLIPVQKQGHGVFVSPGVKDVKGYLRIGINLDDPKRSSSVEDGKTGSIFSSKVGASSNKRPEEAAFDKLMNSPSPINNRWVLDHKGQKSHAEIGREAAFRKARERGRIQGQNIIAADRAKNDTNLLLSTLTQGRAGVEEPRGLGKSAKVKKDDQR